jgi:ribose transport system ATP-binding protein
MALSDSAIPGGSGFVLETRGLGRSFGTVRALHDVSIAVRHGEVLGLAGENGAGKSTLLNLLCGIARADAGEILLRGERIGYVDYHGATEAGVYRVFQELAVLPNLPVWENLFIGHERLVSRAGVIRRPEGIGRAREILSGFGHGWVDVERNAGEYPFAVRQMIEIVRAFALADILDQPNPVLLLDEPTAAASSDEVEFLRRLIERVRENSSVVLVSHRLSEVLEWSDRVVVLKDGEVTGQGDPGELSEADLHYMMVGRKRDAVFYRETRQREPEDDMLLAVTDLSDGEAFHDVSVSVRRGEIVGVAGVLGSGKTELGEAIFGQRRVEGGEVRLRGRDVTNASARAMTLAGVGYVPPERKENGLIDTFSVSRNISAAKISTQPHGILRLREEARDGRRFIERLRIKAPSPSTPVLDLSGGNQQKVILARWLARGVDLLILDNPTRGVDAGAKEEIYDFVRDYADAGVGILLISDDLPEVIGLANRIVILKGGSIAADMPAPPDEKPTEQELVATMV